MEQIRGTPEIPYHLFTDILCAWLSYIQLSEICRVIGLQKPTLTTFHQFQCDEVG
jgi:hypothetical protein